MKDKIKLAHMLSAYVYARCSTAKRLQVGCVIVKDDRIISIGYNGTPPGWDNCCEDEDGNTKPELIHAERNAIGKLAKGHESGDGAVAFITHAPCIQCAQMLHIGGIVELFFGEMYRSDEGIRYLERCNIPCKQLEVL